MFTVRISCWPILSRQMEIVGYFLGSRIGIVGFSYQAAED
jgi:hypothetical protein